MEREIVRGMQVKGALLGLAALVAGSLWGRLDVFLGVLSGVLFAYGDFLLICLLSGEMLEIRSSGLFWVVQVLKYLIFCIIFGLLFFKKVINPIATVCGLGLIMVIPMTEVFRLRKI